MKKIVSIIMSVIIVFSVSVTAFATPSNDFGRLIDDFSVVKADNGMKYAAYEPNVEENTKYPLVVYVHGLGHAWSDTSFVKSGLTYWAGDEMQSKFVEGGAYLLMPKIPETVVTATQTEKVFGVIEEFVNEHKDTIDEEQIYVMGASAGGALTWRLLINHPDYFKRAVVLCAVKVVSGTEMNAVKDIPIWQISAVLDPLVPYLIFAAPTWQRIKSNSAVNEENRHTVFSGTVTLPDGSNASIPHLLAKTIGYNLCYLKNCETLKNMRTVDGNGNTVDVSFDNGIVEWLQADIVNAAD